MWVQALHVLDAERYGVALPHSEKAQDLFSYCKKTVFAAAGFPV
jgi:hypothetical protein